MKIAIFSDTFYPQINGVSQFVLYKAENLAKRGHIVQVFTATSPKVKFDCEKFGFGVVNISSLPAPIYRGQGFRMAVPAGWALGKLRKFNPDVIHTHTPFAIGIEAIFGARRLKIPIVGEHHTFYDHYLKHVLLDYNWAKKMSWRITSHYFNKCDLVVSPSQSLANSLMTSGLKKPVKVIPNGIDTDLFNPLGEDEKKAIKQSYGINKLSIVYMGRVSYEKSIDVVIKAFAKFLKNDEKKNAKLMIIGDGPDRKKLEELCKKLKIEKHVIWTGILRGKILAEATGCNDIFVTASKSENMPLSVLEAMATGLPIIAVSENGLKEIIRDNQNGYLCQADDEDEISEKIKDLFENPNKCKQFGLSSRELACMYSKDKIMSLFEECYLEVIDNYQKK
jgi:1,2-diacylglycerol 3-alpha-glucosyltransferase